MTLFDDQLQKAFDELAEIAPHRQGLADAVRRRSRYRRAVTVAPAIVAVLVAALVGGLFVFRPDTGRPAGPASSACSPVVTEVLPSWARSGFSDPEPRMPVAHSRSGAMLAIIFASPLSSPEVKGGAANKILWVTDAPAGAGQPLLIAGKLEGGSAVSQTSVDGGPGPSYLDVPEPGCWVFQLSWGTHRDLIALPYAAG